MSDKSTPPEAPRLSKPGRILAESGLKPDRRFGQNFLVNQGALQSIIRIAEIGPDTAVVEIGAGVGNLTGRLAEAAGAVIAVELDRNFEPIHRRAFSDCPNVRFHYADFLETPVRDLIPEGEWRERVIVGNIPYNITSRIVMKLLDEASAFDRAYVLMQREVADRLRALPGSRNYSVLTAKLACGFRMAVKLRVSARSFMPPPKVDSSMVEFLPLETPIAPDTGERRAFFSMLDGAFAERRKTLPNSLSNATGGRWPRTGIADALERLGAPPNARADSFHPAELLRLFRALSAAFGPSGIILRQPAVKKAGGENPPDHPSAAHPRNCSSDPSPE